MDLLQATAQTRDIPETLRVHVDDFVQGADGSELSEADGSSVEEGPTDYETTDHEGGPPRAESDSDLTDPEMPDLTAWNTSGESDGDCAEQIFYTCLLYTSPSPRDQRGSRMPSSA